MKHPYRIWPQHYIEEQQRRRNDNWRAAKSRRQKQRQASKQAAYDRQKGRCLYCLQWFPYDEITIEHDKPRVRGGNDARENIDVACLPCNRAKDRLTRREFELAIFKPDLRRHPWELYLNCMTIRIKRATSKACLRIARIAR